MIAGRIKAARDRLGWTREALAYHSGVSWSAISQIESGRRRHARPSTLAALARALGVTVDYLLGETAPPAMLRHSLAVYGSDDEFAAATVPFLEQALGRAEPTLVVATSAHVDLMKGGLGTAARNIQFSDNAEWYSSPIAATSGYGAFATAKMEAGHPWVNIVGEINFATQDRDEVNLWGTYESIFNVMFASSPLTALCLYNRKTSGERLMQMVTDTHPLLSDGEVTAPNDGYVEPQNMLLDSPS
jgi:transcriptional regulator with XRE-family HTH domain